MKRALLLAILILTCTGCDQVVDLGKDTTMEPEDIVVDYVLTISDIYSSESDCDELAKKLSLYCERREEKVTKAISDMLLRIENSRIDAAKRNELYDNLSEIKNAHNTRCSISPRVISEMAVCSKPVLNVIGKIK